MVFGYFIFDTIRAWQVEKSRLASVALLYVCRHHLRVCFEFVFPTCYQCAASALPYRLYSGLFGGVDFMAPVEEPLHVCEKIVFSL